jgi:hypothetical protein
MEGSMFRLELETDNAAFQPQWGAEVARILREVADTVEPIGFRPDGGNLRDINGNLAGYWKGRT